MRVCFNRVWCLLLVVMFSVPNVLNAQQFVLNGTCTQPIKGRVSLLIYDGDTTYRVLHSAVSGGKFTFSGSVGGPVLAQLSHKEIRQPLFFYLENSDITIHLDVQHPSSSPIQGSRTNSQFRYALENCQGDERENCAKRWIEDNPSSLFASFVLYRLPLTDGEEVMDLFGRLRGEAVDTYHYHLLERRLRQLRAVSEGHIIPDVLLPDSLGAEVHLDSLRGHADSLLLLVVGASWCEQCIRIETQLKELSARQSFRLVVVHLDNDLRGWDAPYIEQLAIDHIPYLILLDRKGTVVARDVRIWEVSKILN